MTFSGVVHVGMENITVSCHCKRTHIKKFVVSHARTVWTSVLLKNIVA